LANLLELEKAIIERLKSQIPAVRISPLPLDPAQIGVPVSGSQIWVAYKRSSFGSVKSATSNPVKSPSVDRTIYFELIIRCQQLQIEGHEVAYPIIDGVLNALSGWMPEAIHRSRAVTRPFYPTEDGFTNMGAGLWVYSITFAIDSIFTPKLNSGKFT
jgi:Gp37 protein